MYQLDRQELKRIVELSEFDLDYSGLENSFKDLSRLAAKVAGTDISLINLIDTYTQWTIANHGLEIEQMPIEESVCHYTIASDEPFEIKNLKADSRFFDKPYVDGDEGLTYYFGVQLKTADGNNLGALCVMDKQAHVIDSEKAELLKIIADEIVNRLVSIKQTEELKQQLNNTNKKLKNLAHDIRGPLGGIISLTDILAQQGDSNNLNEVLDFVKMMNGAGVSLLDLATEIMNGEKNSSSKKIEYNLCEFKEKLEKLFLPQAMQKGIEFSVSVNPGDENIAFPKKKLLQIVGNLISNGIKFTPEKGFVNVQMKILQDAKANIHLKIVVKDNGKGIEQTRIDEILIGIQHSTNGTKGESGFGIGLSLVSELTKSLNGILDIQSEIGKGSRFCITIPFEQSIDV